LSKCLCQWINAEEATQYLFRGLGAVGYVYVDEVGGGPEAAERLFIQALLLLRRLPLDAGVGSTMRLYDSLNAAPS